MRIEVVFESDIKILQIKMTSVNCLIYCFDEITGQALQIRKNHFQVFSDMQTFVIAFQKSKDDENHFIKIFSWLDTKRSIDKKQFQIVLVAVEYGFGKFDVI